MRVLFLTLISLNQTAVALEVLPSACKRIINRCIEKIMDL